MKMQQIAKNTGGFTLIEVIVAMVLMILVVLTGYYIFDFNNIMYGQTNKKVEVQEAFRLTADHLEKEVGHAGSVSLIKDLDPAALPPVPAGNIMVYLKSVEDNNRALFERDSAGNETMIGYPIAGMQVTFQVADGSGSKILKMYFKAVGAQQIVSSILLQNTTVITPVVGDLSAHEALYFVSY